MVESQGKWGGAKCLTSTDGDTPLFISFSATQWSEWTECKNNEQSRARITKGAGYAKEVRGCNLDARIIFPEGIWGVNWAMATYSKPPPFAKISIMSGKFFPTYTESSYITANTYSSLIRKSGNAAFPFSDGWFTTVHDKWVYYIKVLDGGVLTLHAFNTKDTAKGRDQCTMKYKGLPNHCAAGGGPKIAKKGKT